MPGLDTSRSPLFQRSHTEKDILPQSDQRTVAVRERYRDRGVEATETGESDAQGRSGTRERWDSRRGTIRHTPPYRQDAAESTRRHADIAQRHDSMRIYIFSLSEIPMAAGLGLPSLFFSSTATSFLGTLVTIDLRKGGRHRTASQNNTRQTRPRKSEADEAAREGSTPRTAQGGEGRTGSAARGRRSGSRRPPLGSARAAVLISSSPFQPPRVVPLEQHQSVFTMFQAAL
jgi:hypothetical protein